MAKLPTIKRILREDLPEAPPWIDKMLSPMNKFFEDVYNALNRNLSFVDNVTGQTKELTFETLAAYDGTAANWENLEFPRTLKRKPTGLLLMQIIQNEDNHTAIETAPYIDWLDENGTIKIYLITGLTASKSYTVKMLLI